MGHGQALRAGRSADQRERAPAARAVLMAFVDRIEIEHGAQRGILFIVADAADVLARADTTRVWNGDPTYFGCNRRPSCAIGGCVKEIGQP